MPTSRRTVDAKIFPVRPGQGSTSAERVAELDAETMRRKGASFAMTDSRGGRRSTQLAPRPRKGFQNLGFDGDLWILSAAAGRKYPAGGMCLSGALHRVLQIAAAGGRTGCAMTEGARAAAQAGGGPPYTQLDRCRVGRTETSAPTGCAGGFAVLSPYFRTSPFLFSFVCGILIN